LNSPGGVTLGGASRNISALSLGLVSGKRETSQRQSDRAVPMEDLCLPQECRCPQANLSQRQWPKLGILGRYLPQVSPALDVLATAMGEVRPDREISRQASDFLLKGGAANLSCATGIGQGNSLHREHNRRRK